MTRKRSRGAKRRSRGSRSKKSQGSLLSRLGRPVQRTLASGASGLAKSTSGKRPEVAGVLLVVVSAFTFLAILTPNQGTLSRWWLDALQVIFGWGVLVAPAVMLLGGLWLVTRKIDTPLPRPSLERAVGWVMLILAAFVLLQWATGAAEMNLAIEVARQGRGGGMLGALLLGGMVRAVGVGGSMVVLAAWILVGLTLATDLDLSDLVGYSVRGLRWLWSQAFPPEPAPLARARPTSAAHDLGGAPSAPPETETAAASEAVQGENLSPEPNVLPAESVWELPDLQAILEPGGQDQADKTFEKERARLIEETLQSFGAPAKVVEINRGPTITQFGVEPDFIEGRGGRRVKVKVSKISSLADDLALALAASSIRVEAPVPGKGFIGIEVPNAEVALVALRDVMESPEFAGTDSPLRLGLGRDVSGHPVVADLAHMPHLLIAGTTGSGKSVCINAVIASLLLQNTPDVMRLFMIDPKRVELTYYNGIPHLLAPVVVDLERVVQALQWISKQMDDRYRRFAMEGVRNIEEFNARMRLTGQKTMHYVVLIVDELADLMMLAPDETERVLTRLAQLARATGIHLVIATQRPSVDVVTGLIKANFPARIAFAVASSVDSRVILDQPGAERLLGHGDMLFQPPDAAAPRRLQGVYVSEPELARLIRYWKNAALGGDVTQPAAPVRTEPIPGDAPLKQAPLWEDIENGDPEDDLFEEAVDLVRRMRKASISMLQRHLRIGYTRAARLIDELEQRGIVGPEPGGSQAREVLDYGDLAPDPGSAHTG